jgi:hypothetical protein
MKKHLISIFVVAAIATAAGWNVSRNMSEEALSDVALANVEALAWEYPTITCNIYLSVGSSLQLRRIYSG